MATSGECIHVRGIVQGVGFRPMVWRIAQSLGVRGHVANDGDGVLIEAWGEPSALRELVVRLRTEAPALARIEGVARGPSRAAVAPTDFRIIASDASPARVPVAADAATCAACLREILDPVARRFRYPFTNCSHCGPRLSIVEAIPYDRANTTMARFVMCAACAVEYDDPADRRFHAQPIACPHCGPRMSLSTSHGVALALDSLSTLDPVDAACTLLQRGHILAIQGIGGYQLACDATNMEVVAWLRARKHRERKPFALMARDIDLVSRYCAVSDAEAVLLRSAAAPIVLLDRIVASVHPRIANDVAPGIGTFGFMLPNTPLHHLLLRRMERPIVLTSGNRSDEPQAIERDDARKRLSTITDYFLEHDRGIARRVDDSVTRIVAGRTRALRRARGYAPASLRLPSEFEQAPPILAFGGELKNTFCLLRGGDAVLSSHIGDLDDALTRSDYQHALADFREYFDFEPQALACDLHPDYASTRIAHEEATCHSRSLVSTQHHHAHIAACLAENGVSLHADPVLGIALDGLGFGDDATFWGGEFLLADYADYRRAGTFKPIALLGGDAAAREPWRNTYAHLMAAIGWEAFETRFSALDLYGFLNAKPRELLDGMQRRDVNAPLASSCGRLFDAVAAATGIVRECALYEGQGAVELEAAIDADCLANEEPAFDYPFAIERTSNGLPYIEPRAMWRVLLRDLSRDTANGVIAARFHRGLAKIIVNMAETIVRQEHVRTIALSGGVFQNRVLFERVEAGLEAIGVTVLSHSRVPCNDGGLALGQAAIAAARMLRNA